MSTEQELRRIAEKADEELPWSGEQKAAECMKYATHLNEKLQENGIDSEYYEGKIRGSLGGTTTHAFVLVNDGEYIVDLTLCQFTEENAIKHSWDVWIDIDNIPEIVICKRDDDLRQFYII